MFIIRNDGRNMKCARVAKRIQVQPSNGNCTRQTYESKFIYSTAHDRRSLIFTSDANTKQRSVDLFAIGSHSIVISPLDLNITSSKAYIYIITSSRNISQIALWFMYVLYAFHKYICFTTRNIYRIDMYYWDWYY